MAKSARAGLIELKLNHPYYRLLQRLISTEHDVIGFYYREDLDESDQNYSVILFDVYSGCCIPCIPLNMHDLKQDPLVTNISTRALNLTDELYSQFRSKLGVILTRELLDRENTHDRLINLRRIIFDETERTYLEGYNIVNSVVAELAPAGSSRVHVGTNVVMSPFLNFATITTKTSHDGESRVFKILYELYRDIFVILRDESFNHDDIQERIMNGFKNTQFDDDDDFGFLSVSERVSPSATVEADFLPVVRAETPSSGIRTHFERIMTELDRGEIPTIYLNEILGALAMTEMRISKNKGTFPAIISLDPYADKNDKVSVTLRSGQAVILPSKGADLGPLDYETLKDVLWYLESLVDHDTTFIPLQNLVTREMALRQKH